jgi:hypothetical protein
MISTLVRSLCLLSINPPVLPPVIRVMTVTKILMMCATAEALMATAVIMILLMLCSLMATWLLMVTTTLVTWISCHRRL